MNIDFLKLSDKAILPKRAEQYAAGLDLFSAREIILQPKQRQLIQTDIAWQVSPLYYGKIEGRSGLAYKNGILVLGGVIDSGYRGNIGVILYNTSDQALTINVGDRIAQLVVQRYYKGNVREVTELNSSERQEGGFGSTGK